MPFAGSFHFRFPLTFIPSRRGTKSNIFHCIEFRVRERARVP